MFGIIYLLYGGTVRIVRSIKKSIADSVAMERTWNDEPGLYRDSLSKRYSIKTGNQMTFTIDERGHRVYKSIKGSECIDLTQMNMDKDYNDAKYNRKSGQTVVRLNENYAQQKQDQSSLHGCKGVRYKDLDNGKIYVVRCWDSLRDREKWDNNEKIYQERIKDIPESCFYMDITNGKLVRVKDNTYDEKRELMESFGKYSQKEIDEKIKEKKRIDNAWIEKHNARQQKWIEEGHKRPLDFYHNCYERW